MLALPQAALTQISLEGFDARRVAEGKLGQNRGMRAVRLADATGQEAGPTEVPEPAFAMAGMDLGGPDLGGGFPAMDMGDMMFQATGTD